METLKKGFLVSRLSLDALLKQLYKSGEKSVTKLSIAMGLNICDC